MEIIAKDTINLDEDSVGNDLKGVSGAPTRTRRLSNEISWLLLTTRLTRVGHFIFVISNSSTSSQINFIGLIGPQDGAVVDEEPIKHSDVLVENPEEIKKHAKKLEK